MTRKPWAQAIEQSTRTDMGYGRKKGPRESYGAELDRSVTAVNERRRLYAEARDAGETPWEACIAAGWDPGSYHARERWYQAAKAGRIVQREDGRWTSA